MCNYENSLPYTGPTVISDFSDGLSSDGRGPYIPGREGAAFSMVVGNSAGFIAAERSGYFASRNA